ncbi:MAG: DUF1934 domain-containing protein [Ruminococcaceae bacterium]|nr:DUF1934 domain-containing protein [Oscillospiraceae bacterium]
MEQNYLVKIETKQRLDGDEEKLQVITHASFSGSRDDYTLIYTEESPEDGESKTELRCEKGEKITVIRFGEGMTTNLILEKGIRHASCHATPYGTFSMGVVALEIDSDMDEKGGTLHFMYATDIENSPLGEITFDFTLKPKTVT